MYYLDTNSPIIRFEKTLQNKIYVDKSMLIHKLNEIVGTGDCYVCITRPRRFGIPQGYAIAKQSMLIC